MKKILRPILVTGFIATLASCGGGSNGSIPLSTPAVLTAGATYTMVKNNSVMVPAGATVTLNGSTTTVQGTNTTTNTSAGAVVVVPQTATGASNDMVTTE